MSCQIQLTDKVPLQPRFGQVWQIRQSDVSESMCNTVYVKIRSILIGSQKNTKPYRHVRMSANVSGSNGIDQLNEKKRTAYYLLIK